MAAGTFRSIGRRRPVGPVAAMVVLLLPAFLSGDAVREGGGPVHTELRESSPEDDAVLEEGVEEIVLTFTTPVQAPLSRIVVTGPDGSTLAAGPVEHPPGREDRLRVVLDHATGPGEHEVAWRTVAPDGHPVEGIFRFRVEGEAPTRPAAAEAPGEPDEAPRADEPDRTTTPPGTGTRWLQLLGSILLLGAVGTRYGVLPALGRKGALPELRERLRSGLWRFSVVGTVFLLVALPLRLRNQLGQLGGEVGWAETSFLLLETAWGAGWFLHLGVVGLALVGLVLAAPAGLGNRGWAVLGGTAVLLPLVPALQGHAWGAADAGPLSVAALYLHVGAAGVWLGGLTLLVLVGLPAVRGTAPPAGKGGGSTAPPLARLVNAFSRLALPAVIVLVLTGVTNSWILIGGLDPLLGSGYGRTLLLKVAVAAAAFTLGFYNWRRVRPRLAVEPDPGTLRIPASVEVVLGVLVLLLTAVLVALPLP